MNKMRQTLTTPALVTGVMLVTLVTVADTRIMTVAAIFDEGGASQHELAFKHAVEAVNRNRCLALIIIRYNIYLKKGFHLLSFRLEQIHVVCCIP